MRCRLLSLLLALAVALPGLPGTAWASPMEDEATPPPEDKPLSPAMAARYTVRASNTGYFGDGSDGDLHIAAGQTVTLPVEVPHQSVVEKNYRNITIEVGGVLTTSAPNAGLILKATGTVTIKGTIDQSAKAPLINPYNGYNYPTELICGNGGDGGRGGIYYSNRSAGGRAMTSRPYGGGYGGGGGGGAAHTKSAGYGGDVDTLQVGTTNLFVGGEPAAYLNELGKNGINGGGGSGSYYAGNEWTYQGYSGEGGSSHGSNGGSARQRTHPTHDYQLYEGGGGGGAGSIGGGVIIIYCAKTLTLAGSILAAGGNGGNGGHGNYGGGGGGGGGGGAFYAEYGATYTNSASLNVAGGSGGVGGWDNTTSGQYNLGDAGSAGTIGSITIKKAPDTTPPVISNVSVTSTWATTNTATVTATDDKTGVAEYAVTTINAAPSSGWQASNSFTLSSNGQYYAWAKDGLGNVSLGKAFLVDRVDAIKPVITSATVAPTGWANSATKTITIAASDGQSQIKGYGLTDNTTAPASWQTANTFARAAGTYYAWVQDLAGNVSSYQQVSVDKIDTIKPVVNSVSVPTVWGASNDITIYAADSGGSNIAEYAVTTTNAAPSYGWQAGNSFTMNANGSYFAWVKDSAENISYSKGFLVDKVDTIKPVITSATVAPTGWANSATKTITIAASDGQSQIKGYGLTDNTTAPASWQTANTFARAAGTYYAWVQDTAGNVSSCQQVSVDKIDTIKPAVNSVSVPTVWGASNDITIYAADSGGSNIVEYAVTTTDAAPSHGWQGSSSFTINANGSYFAWVKDSAGNVSDSKGFLVDKVDTIKPVITSATVAPTGWVNSVTKTITIAASDAQSQIKGYGLTDNTTAPASWQTANTFAREKGTYYAWVQDLAGNVSSYQQVNVDKIDTIKPAVNSVSVPTVWGASNDITIYAADSGGSNIAEYAVTTTNAAPSYGWQGSSSFTINANGSYFAWVKDGAGNVSDGKGFLVDKVDTIKPIVESIAIPDEWAINSTVTLQATDVGSGIAAYAVTVTSIQPRAGSWQAETDFTLSSNGYYHAWAMDLAGNISEGSKFKIDKVDTTAPKITKVELPKDWGLVNTATIQAKDAESGIADYAISSYSFAPSSGWQSSGSFTIVRNGDYYAFAKDRAGNISASAKFTISKVDLDKPVITAVTMPTEWCPAGTLTISATDNSSIVDYALSTGSTVPAEGWQTSNSFAITQNGSYYAWARDEVGNVSSGKYCYITKIDSTPPEIASITWSTSGDTVTVRGKDLASGVAAVYIDDVALSGSYATAALTEEARYIRIVVEDVAGNKSTEQQERVPGWYDELETLTILPVKFTENNQQATITAASTGAAVKGIYVNDKLKMGNPVTVLVSHGTQYLEVQALDVNGDRSIVYQVRVPGWNAVVSTIEIVDVQFAEDNKTAKITAMETGGKGLRGIYVNGELFDGSPVVYDIPAGVQHLEMQAEDNFGDRSALLIRRVPGWSEIVTTMSITDVTYLDYNTTVQVTATATGGDTISGIEVNGELQEGNPVIYKIPKGTELLKLQAVNANGDRSPLVTKSVPKDATKGTLKIAIGEPDWTSSDKARVRVTVSDSSRIAEVMARTSEDNEWVDITDSRYIFITADTTVYASVENEKGELRETSKQITCFDDVAPKVTATQDGNVVNIRATDDKSGIKSILVNNKVYSDHAIFDGKLAYRILDGTSQITVYAEDAAGNLSSAVDLPLQVTVTAMPVIVSPEPETSSQPQPPQEVSLPKPESQTEKSPEPTPEAPPVDAEPIAASASPVAQAAAAVGGIGTTAVGGIWYWIRKLRLRKPVEELELEGKKLLYDESEFGGAIDPDDRQGGNQNDRN